MNWTIFFAVLSQIESGNNPDAVGDAHLRHPAYGIYQIRQHMLDDVFAVTGLQMDAAELARRPYAAQEAIKIYIKYWALKRNCPLTYETAARIHNGGPRGWERESTLPFWRKFEAELKKHERGEG